MMHRLDGSRTVKQGLTLREPHSGSDLSVPLFHFARS